MRFSGFESSLHGITGFDWAIGTTVGAEDIQPYLEDGIIHAEEDDVAGDGNVFSRRKVRVHICSRK